MFHKSYLFNLIKQNLNLIYTIYFKMPTSEPFLNEKLHEDSRYIFFEFQKKIPFDNCVFRSINNS